MLDTMDKRRAETLDDCEQIEKKVRVYIRPADDYNRFLAVAYDLNIAATGGSPKDALNELCCVVEDAMEAALEHGGSEAVRTFLMRGPNAASRFDYFSFRVMRYVAHALLPALPVAKVLADSLAKNIENKAKSEEYAFPFYKFRCPA